MFIEQGRLQEAADQFKWVLERDPASGLARQGLGDVITSHVRLAEAALRGGALDEGLDSKALPDGGMRMGREEDV